MLDKNTGTCICGNVLCEKEKEHIKQYLTMLPPKSYASLYQEFSKTAAMWGKGYDKERLEAYIQNVLEFEQTAQDIDKDIMNLDEEATNNLIKNYEKNYFNYCIPILCDRCNGTKFCAARDWQVIQN